MPGTQVPVISFDPTRTLVCVPLGPGRTPVHETWELVNLATEVHNFHMHQTKFRVLDATMLAMAAAANTAVIMEDNVPIPYSVANIAEITDNQGGYCTIDQWRSGQCTAQPVVVDIPFSQLGAFVYHCHILEHEDGGMMAKIQVVPAATSPSAAHDLDGDGRSDILWRDDGGNLAVWFMNGVQVSSSAGFGSGAHRLVGRRAA